jgi:hypothetical protein
MDSAAPSGHRSPASAAGAPAVRGVRRGRGYGFLLAGVAALALLDLVFAFNSGWWIILMPGGVLLICVGWLMRAVLGWRSALVATAVVAVSYVVLVFATAPLRTLSWWMLVSSQGDALETVVGILEPVRMAGEARRLDPACTQLPGVAGGECAKLRVALRDVGAHGAWREGAVIMLETYSSFNARGGLLHCTRDCTPPPPRPYPIHWKRVAGNWYRWAE